MKGSRQKEFQDLARPSEFHQDCPLVRRLSEVIRMSCNFSSLSVSYMLSLVVYLPLNLSLWDPSVDPQTIDLINKIRSHPHHPNIPVRPLSAPLQPDPKIHLHKRTMTRPPPQLLRINNASKCRKSCPHISSTCPTPPSQPRNSTRHAYLENQLPNLNSESPPGHTPNPWTSHSWIVAKEFCASMLGSGLHY